MAMINYFGTESNPPLFQGWHLKIRFSPKTEPLMIPWRERACLVNSEQVGEKRQGEGRPKNFLMFWYKEIRMIIFVIAIRQLAEWQSDF